MTANTKPSFPRIDRIESLSHAHQHELAELLIACVESGASVSFMLPMSLDKALRFWEKVAIGVSNGERAILVARDELGVVGTVQLVLDQPENQPHRADVAKMLVAPRARRKGLGAALLREVELLARTCRKTVLVLDTVSGSDGERLYTRGGWSRCGTVENYALMPTGEFCATTYFSKNVSM
jgi:GNAT superfamily N-acetyltransferase